MPLSNFSFHRRWIRRVLQIIIFPWGIWTLCGLPLQHNRLRLLSISRKGRAIRRILHIVFYLAVGLPVNIIITGEVLIGLNELVVGEQAKYRFDFDPVNWSDNVPVEIPGPKSQTPPPVAVSKTDAYYNYLTELFSPVIIQKMGYRPDRDIPVFIDFDGNDDPRDNPRNEAHYRPHEAGIHGEVVSETDDSYYLLYCLYHISDYDHPVRELLSSWAYHDSDNEGFMIRVDKKTMRIVEAEAWFHNRFFLANLTGKSFGSEPIQGKFICENTTHILIYCQSMGHGVRCAQPFDLDELSNNVKILRFQGTRPVVPIQTDRRVQVDGTYKLKNFDRWYALAQGPLGSGGRGKGMFEEEISIGKFSNGKPILVGRYIAGIDYAKGLWSRPKPAWSWDDPGDNIPIFIWNFYPSYSFQSHFGKPVSHHYLYNRPVDKTFHMKPEEFYPLIKLNLERSGGNAWERDLNLENSPTREQYWRAGSLLMKKYINRLFDLLG